MRAGKRSTRSTGYYTDTKVQPYAAYGPSAVAGERMDRSRARWADALGVGFDEVIFGPSTSINTYVLARRLRTRPLPRRRGDRHQPGPRGQHRRASAGRPSGWGARCESGEPTPTTGLLDVADFESLLNERTRLVTVPHASNIVGKENDIIRICELAHAVGARVIVDGVSFAPHSIPDVAELGADVYLFSLYKTYSVHQGLMVVRRDLMAELPNQGHFFNDASLDKRLNPAGPDHAQVASAGAVLDYVEALHRHHGGGPETRRFELHPARCRRSGVHTRTRSHPGSSMPSPATIGCD